MTDAMRLSICVVVGLIRCFLALSFGAANTPLSDVFNGLFSQDSGYPTEASNRQFRRFDQAKQGLSTLKH